MAKKMRPGHLQLMQQRAARTKALRLQKLRNLNRDLDRLPSPLDAYPVSSLDALLETAKVELKNSLNRTSDAQNDTVAPLRVFFSFTDATERAQVVNFTGQDLNDVWDQMGAWLRTENKILQETRWLRVDWVDKIWPLSWKSCQNAIKASKRNYFRYGISLDRDFECAFLEQELHANAMLYLGGDIPHGELNQKNFLIYGRARYGKAFVLPKDQEQIVYLFATKGIFLQAGQGPVALHGFSGGTEGRDTGRRELGVLDKTTVESLIDQSSRFLGAQVDSKGRFVYGLHPCFDREIKAYNTLRHASTIYAMLEAWEVTRNRGLKAAIDRSLKFLTQELIRTYPIENSDPVAYLLDVNKEIKLGGNAVCLLALVKYTELTSDEKYLGLLEKLAAGILRMQNPTTGQLYHVLNSDDLTVKEKFRIIYYDGEAAFGLMRLYGLTNDNRWIHAVEKAFDYFIAQKHWKIHDHWLSYCVNELTLYRPEERYFEFGILNVNGHLDFVIERITTFPTLLELMMAAHKMIVRLHDSDEHRHLLKRIDLEKFYCALEVRARHLLNGFFWPEFAMFFKNPQRIVGSFFIRHHSFRVRIDDVEHYLSGYVAYLNHYLGAKHGVGDAFLEAPQDQPSGPQKTEAEPPLPADATLAWGGDVNLGRRQHYRARQIGYGNVLAIPELRSADLSIVNLECVVSNLGEQGAKKGEGGPYYYRARPEMLQALASAQINMVTVANNHSGDYGANALLQQKEILDGLGIVSAGSGPNRDAAFRPEICQAGNLRVAVFSVDSTQHRFAATDDTAGTAYLPLQNADAWQACFESRIAAAKLQADLVIVAVHWGANNAKDPSKDEINIGHKLIDLGADAVMGASAHCLQGIEIYNNKPIIYDAGDLLFDSVRTQFADGGLFRLGLSTQGVRWVEFIPVGIGFGFSQRLEGEAAQAVVQRYKETCQRLGTTLQTDTDRGFVSLLPASKETTPIERRVPCVSEYNLGALEAYRAQPCSGQVEEVPDDARISPVTLNGLTLLGVRLNPTSITRRRMLWIETWWSIDQPVDDDRRISYIGVPKSKTQFATWGHGMDHDPCDWMQPTSRWVPGKIYRDYYGVRPPQMKQLKNLPLQIEVRVVGRSPSTDCYVHPVLVPVRIPVLDKEKNLQYRTEFPGLSEKVTAGTTWTAEQIQSITGGRWLTAPPKGWFVSSVVNGQKHIGMRSSPTLFVAHTNYERALHEGSTSAVKTLGDRHPLVAKYAAKLAGAIVSKPIENVPEGFPLLQVKDPIKAHIELGLAARQRYKGPVIAVTGTVGKSSTVGLLETLFDADRCLKSIDNYNSRVGVPIQLSSLAPDNQAAILEIAQSALWMQRGPITRQIRPTISIITEIGLSQTDRMIKTTQDAARWKSHIFDGLTPDGVAIIGEHLTHFDQIHADAANHAKEVVTFGTSPDATLRILDQSQENCGTRMKLQIAKQVHDVTLPFVNQGMLRNALTVLAVGHVLGRELNETAKRFDLYRPEEGRLDLYDCFLNGKNIQVLDDSWNATTLSMLNAFKELGRHDVAGRKIAVLGRIVHLGSKSAMLHASLAQPLLESGVDLVLTHGEDMKHLRKVLPKSVLGGHFTTTAELMREVEALVEQGDFVLLKGSRRDSDFGDLASGFGKGRR
ncbi:CapA family protein [Roseovarius aestuarii]|nr:CapA family protein [Roseovarius aestuarii]